MKGGGLNFVHGGISLQEMVVPVIDYHFLRNDSKEYELHSSVHRSPHHTLRRWTFRGDRLHQWYHDRCKRHPFLLPELAGRHVSFSDSRVYVIISDAMRYEVAVALAEQLRRETQADRGTNSSTNPRPFPLPMQTGLTVPNDRS